jgi:uncharacterized repeat protein (TIGR01451 family)
MARYAFPAFTTPRRFVPAHVATSNTATVTIPPAPVLSVQVTQGGSTFTQGSTGTWDITVPNAAGSAATRATVYVQDTLPSGHTVNSASGSSWTCTGAGTQTLNCQT